MATDDSSSSLAERIFTALVHIPERFVDKVSMIAEIEDVLSTLRTTIDDYTRRDKVSTFLETNLTIVDFEDMIFRICGIPTGVSVPADATETLDNILVPWIVSLDRRTESSC